MRRSRQNMLLHGSRMNARLVPQSHFCGLTSLGLKIAGRSLWHLRLRILAERPRWTTRARGTTFARSHAQTEVCSRQRGSGSGRRSGLAFDGTIFDPNDPQLVQIEIPLSRLPEAWDGITITQFSAFHYDDRFSVVPLRKAIDVVNRLRPNSLVLTEDLCSSSLQEIST